MKKIRGEPHSRQAARKVIMFLCLTLFFAAIFTITAFADGEPASGTTPDLFAKAKELIIEIYAKIVGISTVLAALMSAVAVIGMKLSSNQHKTDAAWDWLKRIWVAWAIINSISAFIALISPMFEGLGTLS